MENESKDVKLSKEYSPRGKLFEKAIKYHFKEKKEIEIAKWLTKLGYERTGINEKSKYLKFSLPSSENNIFVLSSKTL